MAHSHVYTKCVQELVVLQVVESVAFYVMNLLKVFNALSEMVNKHS